MNSPNAMFRFQELKVWQRSADLAVSLANVANELELSKKYRFAEQLRAAALSISNNIAEGSGSYSNKEFRRYLNIARCSAFESANMLLIFKRQNLIDPGESDALLTQLDEACRMITGLAKSLN